MDVELLKTLSKFPFAVDTLFYDSNELKQNKTCSEKCKERDCLDQLKLNESFNEYTCSKGYNNIIVSLEGFKFMINGVIYKDNLTVPKGRKDARLNYIFDKNEIQKFIAKLNEIEVYLTTRINDTTQKNFSMFHDFKTSMTIFFKCTEDIISKLPGNTFKEKLDNSDSSYKDLYNSLELITSQLGMVDVIINPKSILFGKKKSINIFQLFEKIKILFGHLSKEKQDITISLVREGWIDNCDCYESIEFIPLILLDNALKYSVQNTDIEIKFEQNNGYLKVLVKNIGPTVADENKQLIFNKFFRDSAGKNFSKEGIGMGLYIAKEILNAHGSDIKYHKITRDQRNIGLNIFEFELPIVANAKLF